MILIFLEYFSKKYLDISSPSIKSILTNIQEGELIANIICSIINGIDFIRKCAIKTKEEIKKENGIIFVYKKRKYFEKVF